MVVKVLKAVECIAIEKRGLIPNRHDVYVLRVEWSSGQKHPIHRKFSDFFDFEKVLKERFGSSYALPPLPSRNPIAKALKLERIHMLDISQFCQCVLKLPADVSQHKTVLEFFKVWYSDFPMEEQLEDKPFMKRRDAKKKNDGKNIKGQSSIDSIDSVEIPTTPTTSEQNWTNNIEPVRKLSASSATEDPMLYYVSNVNYAADSPDELSLEKGKRYLVVERNDDGWWIIMCESDGQTGYAPGSFLSPELPQRKYSVDEIDFTGTSNTRSSQDCDMNPKMKATVICNYIAQADDEMSITKNEEVEVLHAKSDGWWLVRCNGKLGLVPAVSLHVDPHSARDSKIQLRNNSLYAKKPPPRIPRQIKHTPKLKEKSASCDIVESPSHSLDEQIMASNKANPLLCKTKSDTPINYAQLTFDDNNAPQTVKVLNEKKNRSDSEKVIYTEIIPKNLRNLESERLKTSKIEDVVEESVKKPEKSSKKNISKTESSEPKSSNKPSVPVSEDSPKKVENVLKKIFAFKSDNLTKTPGSESEESVKKADKEKPSKHIVVNKMVSAPVIPERDSSGKRQHIYENTSITTNPLTNGTSSPTYVNIPLENSDKLADPGFLQIPRYMLRRSSVETPPVPSVEAPKPANLCRIQTSEELISPVNSRVQAIMSYDGPMISGMLMFTKGDTATCLSKASQTGWWYVNLKGLEGYVPGAYWETLHEKSSPLLRHKPPQPMPRHHSPPSTPPVPAASERSELEQEPWYHGKMSRPESEKILSSHGNGMFLIRESVNRVGDLTLSVKWEGKVRHFPIEAKEGGLFYIGKHDFKTLTGVISHYSKHALFYSESNEPVKLCSPASKT